jgi:hypothetical protein
MCNTDAPTGMARACDLPESKSRLFVLAQGGCGGRSTPSFQQPSAAGAGQTVGAWASETGEPETRRTPWLAAGCNKPARLCVEQTAEAGKNGMGGTSGEVGILAAEGRDARTDRPSSLKLQARALLDATWSYAACPRGAGRARLDAKGDARAGSGGQSPLGAVRGESTSGRDREWTRTTDVDGGARPGQPQERSQKQNIRLARGREVACVC